ncbi:MAG: M20 family metallo-hydrolase [Pelagimonas sp.]|jgi:allantoate deiminase|uniref:M20 family metallo-hydrolase n=1 Tax=Pelagimonas sp. TaxID=2073170 RepID=UPI003D6B8A3C
MNWGQCAQDRLSDIARCSVDTTGVTRFPFTPQHEAALDVIRLWMSQAGLKVHMDAAGTLIGRKEGPKGAPTFLIGSHQDSVRNGGRYDGIMGVVLGCLALEKLVADGIELPFSVEILAFADEEGVRFPTALMGPRALAGTFDHAVFAMTDSGGVSLRDALAGFGGDPDRFTSLAREPAKTLGYLEAHIEQGPVLEAQDSALGLVTGICGIERNTVTFTGDTGHAGTVPMDSRRDALVAASDFISAIHDAAKKVTDLRATIGALSLHPNVVNAIPRAVELTLEIRALNDAVRDDFARLARSLGDNISGGRRVGFSMERTYEQPAVPCNGDLIDVLSAATGAICPTAPRLPSGATHDASAMADLCPISMLFVRCKDGVSHKPEEFAASDDMDAAIQSIAAFLVALEF